MMKALKIQDGNALDFKSWIETNTDADFVKINRTYRFTIGSTTEASQPVNGTNLGNIILSS